MLVHQFLLRDPSSGINLFLYLSPLSETDLSTWGHLYTQGMVRCQCRLFPSSFTRPNIEFVMNFQAEQSLFSLNLSSKIQLSVVLDFGLNPVVDFIV